ncbi:DUF6708 domain-containing protein [Luteimonas sp. R10]|uniref:DUF6708 domain-containing protein n=1 Tax=Luteimonas sp. R10 TaxID=3108176 RepID=UPI003091B961|nr:DUF6708 domain-containing protein [Luteimonas sp. R10]
MTRKNNPNYDIRIPEWNQPDPWFQFGEAVRNGTLLGGKLPWRVAPEDKRVSVHGQASTCDALLNVYPDAIEVGAPAGTPEMTFMLPFFAIVGLLSVGLVGWINVSIFSDLIAADELSWPDLIFLCFSLSALVIFFLATVLFFKIAFFTPRDIPVLFNRSTGEVSFFSVIPVRFWEFWKKVGVDPAQTCKWDDLRARSYKMTEFTGSAGRESHLLALLWGEPDDPRQCKEIVTIGYKGWWEDELLWRLYEHIRRYMEEGGPPIQPGESLRISGTGRLPAFPPEIVAAAGGPALSAEEVHRLAGQAVA